MCSARRHDDRRTPVPAAGDIAGDALVSGRILHLLGVRRAGLVEFATHGTGFSDNHPDPHVIVLLSLGEWWDGTSPYSRNAFAFRIWLKGNQFQVGVIDAQDAGWPDASIMGRRMTRAEALAHPLIQEAFHISDHITEEDPAIRAYFQRAGHSAA